jgi:ribosomal protein L12E/L44/L45/RPP1/RPP2
MLYKAKPEIVLIAVSIEGDEVTEPRYITGKSVEEVVAVIDAAFPAAEPSSAPEPKKVRKPRRTKAQMTEQQDTVPAESKGKPWAD